MTGWKAKRFWRTASARSGPDGWSVFLDDKPVKSPGRRPFAVPSQALADAVTQEWNAVEEVIDPRQMPFTRSVNSALDQLAPQRDDVIDMLAAYGETDLLCHRAAQPKALAERQIAAWDPLLAWAAQKLQAPLVTTIGVLPTNQPPESLKALRQCLLDEDDFALTALYDLIALSGSLVLGLSVRHGHISADAAWTVSRIDEDWQIEEWGEDAEATARAENNRSAFLHAETLLKLLSAD